MATQGVVIQLPEVFIGAKVPSTYEIQFAEQAGIIMEQPQTPIWQFVISVGIALATLIFLFKIGKLYWLKHRNPKRWQGNVLIVKLIKSSAAFSFFNTIFLGERIPETEKATIFKHELVHIKELHTLDLLFFELLRIVFWFNPLVYMYQNRIKELHEYIADAKAVKENGKSAYYHSLLNQVFDVNNVSFTNTFFKKSLIKKRINMLQKTKSKQLNLIKYALVIPMVFGMLIYTSTEVRAQNKIQKEKVIDQELTDEELLKKYYDEFVSMKKNGATFFEISEASGMKGRDNESYLMPRKVYLKFKAYMEYIADGIIERKSSEGTLTQDIIKATENMRVSKFDSYKAWKNTDEAKEHWEANAEYEELRFVVNDLGNKTDKEQKRFDNLLNQLNNDKNFSKLIVCEAKGGSKIVLYDSDNRGKDSDQNKTRTETVEVPFSAVDESPTLADCKDLSTNQERKNCMNSFVNKHLVKNFNTSLADSLSQGRKRIFVQFKIDTLGYVTDIKARGPSEELEDEAKRVVSTLPQFTPGRHDGKVVAVPYSLPIVFQVADSKKN
jgi:hypothetical protein